MVSNNLASIFVKINRILPLFQQPALVGVIPANITAFEDLYRFQIKYYETLERILKQITGQPLLPQLSATLVRILPVIQPYLAIQQQIVIDIEAAISGIEAYLIQNAGMIIPAIKVHKENLARIVKLHDLYKKLDEKFGNIITIATQIVNNPVDRQLPPVLPPPIVQPIHPVLNPKHPVILNYVNASKDQLFDIIVRKLPYAIVGHILDKSNTDWAFDNISAESTQDLFTNKLVSKLAAVGYPTTDVSKEINRRIIDNIIPFYKEICELSVKDIKRMSDAYINYIANECQYIKIFKLLLDRI